MSEIARVLREEERPTIAGRLMRLLVGRFDAGEITVRFPGGEPLSFEGEKPGALASIDFKRWRALVRLIAGGDIGFADAYRAGEWDTADLVGLLTWAMENENAIANVTRGNALARMLNRVRHDRCENSRSNSKRNIAIHYDLGNEFYAKWLDAGMNYSSGIYRSSEDSLEDAQARKIDRVCDFLGIEGGQSVLEIGCGWGAVAERLVASHGCAVTGVTLSKAQRAYATDRLSRSAQAGSVDIRLQDYRDVEGRFDRIVSIEMLEAVGEEYWPQYFAKLRDCLVPGGVAVLQVITIAPERYAAYRARPDYIQLEIFPGGALPTAEIIETQAACAGLTVTRREMFAESYARTLAEWRRRFNDAWSEIAPLGFDEQFRRRWNYYLAYCEVGFRARALDVGLYRIERATS
jgi:cyclopropane-fatty-acyl-phospholipid synthase